MQRRYTATYTKIDAGYMGQVAEWPEVITEGKNLEECRFMLQDALHEMILAYGEQDRELPPGDSLIEQVPIELSDVGQAS